MKNTFILSIPAVLFGILIFQNYKSESFKLNEKDISIEVLFSPEDDIKSKLINLIDNEKESIFCAAFRLTEKSIAMALLNALLRGVKIIIIVDSEGFSGMFSKVIYLFKEGIPIYVFPPINKNDLDDERKEKPLSSRNALMHNKFFLFKSQDIVFTGSYNYTRAAEEINQENVLIIKSKNIYNSYKDYFSKLSEKSTILKALELKHR